MNEIIRLEQINARLGSCPECGKSIWEEDEIIEPKYEDNYTHYCCMECGLHMKRENIIPF
jgi:DNA-directed RNA polymerase subunit RPC12/RpoP